MASIYLATLYDNPRSESTGLVSNARPVWGSKEKREWNGVPTRNAYCQHPSTNIYEPNLKEKSQSSKEPTAEQDGYQAGYHHGHS